jgi:hypothetical protein
MKLGSLARGVMAMLVVAAPASAQPKAPAPHADCDLIEVSAKQGDKASIDADLKPIEKKLTAYSFNQFTSLGKTSKSFAKQKEETVKLKLGTVGVTFIEIVDKSKVRLKVTIDDASGNRRVNTQVTVEGGDYLVVGYPISKDKKDGHLLALTCK